MSINLYVLLDTSIDSTNSTKLNIEELKKKRNGKQVFGYMRAFIEP